MDAEATGWEAGMPHGGTATATFLFCDMVGSTDLLTRLGDDAGDEVRRDIYTVLRRAVALSRGIEVKSTGDGLMVVFPSSVGDAVTCAIAMQRGVARLDRANPLIGIGLRVGVAVGEAVQEEGDWYGTPVVEAARLCAAARAGQIVVADLVPALVGSRGGHRFTSLGSMALKGLDDVSVSEVTWEPDAGRSVLPLPSTLDAAATTPMVDRWSERDSVLAAWRSAANGSGRAVVVSGEAGIGRTRLVAEVARAVHTEGGVVLYGRCHEDLAVPYEPFSEAIGWYAGVCPVDDLRNQMGASAGELTRLVPGLALRVPDLAPPIAAGTEAGRERLFEAVSWLLGAVAESAPTMLVVDDLHLATPPTVAMLERVLRDTGGSLLVVATICDSAEGGTASLDELLARIRRQQPVEHIALAGLDANAVAELLAIVSGRPADPDRAEALRNETDGNPALVARLARDASEGGSGSLPCPYMGLAPFQPEDGELFFGREDVVDGLLSRLANARMLALVGASGSGKSSVLRAGVLPAIWRGALPASASWRVALFAPGRHPLAELAASIALLDHRSASQLLADLEVDPRALDLVARQVLSGANPAARLVVVIDQLEEIFTVCESDEERERFVDAVVHASTVPGGRTVVVTCLRADFYGHVAAHPQLAAAVEANHVLLGPLREDDLRAAVERPARAVGMRLESGLVDLVIADAGHHAGALPLVSHALAETWKQRRGRTLTVAGYRTAGGVRGALAATAEEVWAALAPEEQALARRLLLRLVEVGDGTEDTGRRLARSELLADGDERASAVLDRLTEARLLLAGDTTVEIAHEALIRGWPRLRAWLDEDRNSLQVISHLRDSARAWERSGHDESELYRGARLAAVLDLIGDGDAALDRLQRDFLDACRRREEVDLHDAEARVTTARRVNRRLRGLLAAVALLLVTAVLAGVVALDQRADARAAERLADARRVGTAALIERDLDLALLLAVAGVRLENTPETRGNLLATIERSPRAFGIARTDGARLQSARLSPDGGSLLAGDNVGGMHVLDTATHQWSAEGSIEGWAGSATYTDDGEQVLVTVIDEDGAGVAVLDAATLEPSGIRYGGYDDDLFVVGLDPTGRYLAAGSDRFPDGPAQAVIWDRERPDDPVAILDGPGPGAWGLSFSPDGRRLHLSTDGGHTVWETESWTEVQQVEQSGPYALSPDGATIAGVGNAFTDDGRDIQLYDALGGDVVGNLTGHRGQVNTVVFDATGDRIATASDDQTVAVWDADTGEQLLSLEGHSGRVTGLAFSSDGRTLYSAALDRSVIAWDLVGDRRLARLVHSPAESFSFSDTALPLGTDGAWLFVLPEQQQLVARLADGTEVGPADTGLDYAVWMDTSPDGRFVATVGEDGTVVLLDATTLEELRRAPTVDGEINLGAIAFAPDGDTFVVGAEDGTVAEFRTDDLEPTGRSIGLGMLVFGVRRAGDDLVLAMTEGDEPDSYAVTTADLTTGETNSLQVPVPLSAAALAPSGRFAGIAGDDGRVAIIDVRRGELVGAPVLGHDGPVGRVVFSPDGTVMASGGFDGILAFWDVASGQLLATAHPGASNVFVFPVYDSDGTVRTASNDGTTTEFASDADAWVDHACRVAGRDLTEDEWADAFGDRPYESTCPVGS